MSTVYEVATKLTLINGVSGALAVIAKEVLTLEGGIGRLNKSLANTRTLLAVGGGLAVAGGIGLLAGLKSVADHGDKLLHQQVMMTNNGIKQNEVLRMQADFYDNIAKKIPTASAADYLKQVNELRSVFGDTAKAEKMAPWSLMLDAVVSSAAGKHTEGEGFKIWRALEEKGITTADPEGAKRLAGAMAQNIGGSAGKLSAADFVQLGRRGGAAWIKADPEFIAGPLSVLAASLKGEGAGTAMMTLNQLAMGATQMGKEQGKEMMSLGLIRAGAAKFNKGGDMVGVKPGGMMGSELAMTNPYRWVNEVLMPAIHKKYGNDEHAIEQSLAVVGRNRNARKMFEMFGGENFKDLIAKDIAVWRSGLTTEGRYNQALAKDPTMAKEAFNKQYESMMQAIGAPMMQAAIPVMKAVQELFTSIGALANKNPETVKLIAEGLALLGTVMIGAGAAAILAAIGPAGWFGLGISSLAVAVTAAWPMIKVAWGGMTTSIGEFAEGMKNWGERFGSWLDGILTMLGQWISKAWGAITGMFSGASAGGAAGLGAAAGDAIGSHLSGGGAAGGSLPLMARGNGDIVSVGKALQAEGLRVSEHPAFGGVHPVHHGLGHYQGRAIDVNMPGGIVEAAHPAAAAKFDALAGRLRGQGLKVIWRAPGHYNHMHVEVPRRGAMFTPPTGGRQYAGGGMPHVTLEIDGRELGRAASTHMARHHEHPTQSPYFNGRSMFAGPDHQFAAG